MDIQDYWEKALKNTEVIRPRIQSLSVSSATQLPYIFLAESGLNQGDTVVRKGEVMVDRPSLILPSNLPQLEGFDPDENLPWDPARLMNFLLIRGIRFPSLKYNNKIHSLDIFEGRLKQAVGHYLHELQEKENLSTGLVMGPEDCWQLSLLIFIAGQVIRQAEGDIRKLWEDFGNK